MINESKVQEIAELAQLKLTNEEIKTFAAQLAPVLGHFDQLAKINTEKIEPVVTASDIVFRERPDEVNAFPQAVERVLANAPEKKNNLFKVPPVV